MARIGDGGDLLKCSFCGKSQKQVQQLIAGPGVYICDECVELCNEIIEERLAEAGETEAGEFELPKPKEIFAFLESHVYNRSKVFSDDATYYTGLRKKFDHRKVIHKTWEWARREGKVNVHTNTIESVWAIVKRALYGTFHQVSKHRLDMYLDEFCFRYDWRKVSDAVRFQHALDRTDGRLKWYFKEGCCPA